MHFPSFQKIQTTERMHCRTVGTSYVMWLLEKTLFP